MRCGIKTKKARQRDTSFPDTGRPRSNHSGLGPRGASDLSGVPAHPDSDHRRRSRQVTETQERIAVVLAIVAAAVIVVLMLVLT